jgi:hypothetical protein
MRGVGITISISLRLLFLALLLVVLRVAALGWSCGSCGGIGALLLSTVSVIRRVVGVGAFSVAAVSSGVGVPCRCCCA